MNTIKLHNGLLTLVDDDLYEFLNKFNWTAQHTGAQTYAIRRDSSNKKIYMHRVIIDAPNDLTIQVDHINGNSLDNRRSNLRLVSRAKNALNRINQDIGVRLTPQGHHYAQIMYKGKYYSKVFLTRAEGLLWRTKMKERFLNE